MPCVTSAAESLQRELEPINMWVTAWAGSLTFSVTIKDPLQDCLCCQPSPVYDLQLATLVTPNSDLTEFYSEELPKVLWYKFSWGTFLRVRSVLCKQTNKQQNLGFSVISSMRLINKFLSLMFFNIRIITAITVAACWLDTCPSVKNPLYYLNQMTNCSTPYKNVMQYTRLEA